MFTAGSKTYFHNPANGSVWEEPGLCHDTYSPASAPATCGSFKLKEVSGNTIFGIAKMNQTGTTFRYRMIAFDFSNKSMQVSWNLANAPIPEANYVYTRAFALGDQLMYPYRASPGMVSQAGARVNNGTTGSALATMIWSPPAISVSDAWNLSKGDLISAGDPITGGVGTRYSSGVGVQNLTASAEGADLIIDEAMTNITFQYNSSAAGTTTNGNGTTWQVADIRSGGSSNPGLYMEILVGDTLYFSADDANSGRELWAHDYLKRLNLAGG